MKKPIWKSKTALSAFGIVAVAVAGYATGEMSLVEAILYALAGFGAYGFRDAMPEAPGPRPGDVDFSRWKFPAAGEEERE